MRLAYATTDEVNQALATRIAAACGAVVCRLSPGDTPPDGLFDAVLYDLDDIASEERPAFLERLCLDPPVRPTAVHGYGVTDEQANALRRNGIVVVRRLRSSLLRRWCLAARPRLATISSGDTLTDLTWVNVVD